MEQLFGLQTLDERDSLKKPGPSRFFFQSILSPVGRWTYSQRPFSSRARAWLGGTTLRFVRLDVGQSLHLAGRGRRDPATTVQSPVATPRRQSGNRAAPVAALIGLRYRPQGPGRAGQRNIAGLRRFIASGLNQIITAAPAFSAILMASRPARMYTTAPDDAGAVVLHWWAGGAAHFPTKESNKAVQ
jgi:hypothetical protein